MKKLLIMMMTAVVVAFVLPACSDRQDEPQLEEAAQDSHIRSVDDAISLAINASAQILEDDITSRAPLRTVSSKLQVKTKMSVEGRSVEPLFYVVNFDNEAGFAIVPTDIDNENVIAVVEEGSYDPAVPHENAGFQSYIEAAESYLKSDIAPEKKFSPFSTRASNIEVLTVEPRVTMIPHQKAPEHKYSKGPYAGCGPIAMLMAMSFVKDPTSLKMTFKESGVMTEYFNWDDICQHNIRQHNLLTGSYGTCQTTDSGHESISLLCREIGYRTNSTYTTTATGTAESDLFSFVRDVMPVYSYEIFEYGLSCDDLNSALWDGIVLITGWDSSHTEGHYWIADGIQRYVYNNGTDIFGNTNYGEISTIYYHFNWGWGGQCNGYFSPDVLDPNNGSIYDYNDNSSVYHYSIMSSGVAFYKQDNKYVKP